MRVDPDDRGGVRLNCAMHQRHVDLFELAILVNDGAEFTVPRIDDIF